MRSYSTESMLATLEYLGSARAAYECASVSQPSCTSTLSFGPFRTLLRFDQQDPYNMLQQHERLQLR